MAQLFTNNAVSALTTGVTNVETTFVVVDGGAFPSPTGGDYFLATLYTIDGTDEVNHEVVKCTARAGNSLTVVRAQEGTTARQWGVGAPVELRITAGTLAGFNQSAVTQSAITARLPGNDSNQLTVTLNPLQADGIPTVESVSGASNRYPRLGFKTGTSEKVAVGYNGTLMVGTTTELAWGRPTTKSQQVGQATTLFDLSGMTMLGQNCYYDGLSYRYIEDKGACRLFMSGDAGGFSSAPAGSANNVIPLFSPVFAWDSAYNFSVYGNLKLSKDRTISISNVQVIGPRQSGWTAATGTAWTGPFVTGTATTQQCAERIKAIEDALRTHGLIN